MVVDDGHPGTALQQVLAHDLLRAVGVHHHQQRPRIGQDDGVLGGEERLLILRRLTELAHHISGGIVARFPDDAGLYAPLPGDGAHPGTGADAVQVREFMAHDKDIRGVGNELAQCIGHDTALHLGALLHLLAAAAVEFEVEFVFHHGLVAAPGEGHLDGERGILQQFLKTGGVFPHADGERGGHAAGAGNIVYGVEYIEFGLLKMLEIALFKEEEIAVPVIAAEETAGGGHPGGQTLVNLAEQGGAPGFVGGFHRILIVVQQQHGHHRLRSEELLFHGGVVGDLHPVSRGQRGRAAALLLGADQGAEDQETLGSQLHLPGTGALSLQEPPGIEAGDQCGELGVKEMVPLVGELEKPLVGPYDFVGVRLEEDHGQGRVEHSVPAGRVHVGRHRVDISKHLLFAKAVAAAKIEVENDDHDPLHHGQRHGKQSGGGSKKDQAGEIEPQTGLQQVGELFVLQTHTSLKLDESLI